MHYAFALYPDTHVSCSLAQALSNPTPCLIFLPVCNLWCTLTTKGVVPSLHPVMQSPGILRLSSHPVHACHFPQNPWLGRKQSKSCDCCRRRPKRARATLPRAPSPLPSAAPSEGLTNDEENAVAAIAALGAVRCDAPVVDFPREKLLHLFVAMMLAASCQSARLSFATHGRSDTMFTERRLASDTWLRRDACRAVLAIGASFPCGEQTVSSLADNAEGSSGHMSEPPAGADSEDEDYEREAAVRGRKRPRQRGGGVGGGGGGGAGTRRFGRHARQDAVKVWCWSLIPWNFMPADTAAVALSVVQIPIACCMTLL